MFRKVLSLIFIALLINVIGVTPVRAGAQVVKRTRNVGKVKENIRKLGAGDPAYVELKPWDARKLRGYIREAREDNFSEDNFSVADAKTGDAGRVAYTRVEQFKGSDPLTAARVGLSLAGGVAIVGAVALGFTLLALIFTPKT